MDGKQIVTLVIASLASGCAMHHPIPTDSLQSRLNDLMKEQATPREQLTFAMCYQRAEPEDIAASTFLCPVCGRKTRHPGERVPDSHAALEEHDRFRYQNKIPDMIRSLQEGQKQLAHVASAAKNYGLILSIDATDLCAFCRQTDPPTNRSLYLVVEKQDGTMTRHTYSQSDLDLLCRFLTAHTWRERDAENRTLRDRADTIRCLLGLKNF